MIAIGEKVEFKDDHFADANSTVVPFGTTLRFMAGFMIRQHADGMNFEGSPPRNFWTVLLEEKDDVAGITLPEGNEPYVIRVKSGERTRKVTKQIHHEPTFVPLHRLRCVSVAEIVALPT